MMARHDHDSARPSTCEMRVVHKSSYKQCKVNKELAPSSFLVLYELVVSIL